MSELRDDRTADEPWVMQYRVDCYDPGDMPGVASLLGVEGAWLMDDVTGAVEPHETRLRQLLGLADEEVTPIADS